MQADNGAGLARRGSFARQSRGFIRQVKQSKITLMTHRMPRTRSLAISLALLLVVGVGDAAGQRLQMNENLARQLEQVELQVVSGRILSASPTPGGRLSSTTNVDDRREQLTIDFGDGRPAIDYYLGTDSEQITIRLGALVDARLIFPPPDPNAVAAEIEAGLGRLVIRRTPRSESTVAVQFVQLPGHSLTLSVGSGEHRQVYRAATLWYLLLSEPEVAEEHLLPLLDLLRPNWRLMDTVAEIEHALMRGVELDIVPDRSDWATLVDELADDRFSVRRQADLRLRGMGPAIVPFLESLDREQLDAEQQFRIRRILALYHRQETEDVPARLGSLAVSDPRAWLALLNREERSQRQLAANQLSRLLGEPIDFDPNASEELRAAQIERLRNRFEPPPARIANEGP